MKKLDMKTHKFMQTLDQKTFRVLSLTAKQRGCTVQDLIRVIIVPDWYANYASRLLKVKAKRRRKRRDSAGILGG